MTDTTTTNQPYTLESADFLAIVKLAVLKASGDIKTIENDVETLTSKFKADIQTRQARKADLELIVAHGTTLVSKIEADAANVVEVIDSALKAVLDNVGKDLTDFGAMLGGKQRPAPQLTVKAVETP